MTSIAVDRGWCAADDAARYSTIVVATLGYFFFSS